MGQSEATRQNDFNLPPTYGGVLVLATSSTAAAVNLALVASSPYVASDGALHDESLYPLGHYLAVQADGADCYVLFADTYAHAAGIVTTDVTAVDSAGAPAATNTATGAVVIPNGMTLKVKVPKDINADGTLRGKGKFLGYRLASGSGYLRIWQVSP